MAAAPETAAGLNVEGQDVPGGVESLTVRADNSFRELKECGASRYAALLRRIHEGSQVYSHICIRPLSRRNRAWPVVQKKHSLSAETLPATISA